MVKAWGTVLLLELEARRSKTMVSPTLTVMRMSSSSDLTVWPMS